jgi:hypothetical protein
MSNPAITNSILTSPVYAGSILIFQGLALNFQATTDQQLARMYAGTNYIVTSIVARQRSGGASVTCAGGIYDAASKGGHAIVAATQSWVTLASGVVVTAALAALAGTTLLANTPFLSLTTGSTAAVTGDVYIYGYDAT